jgi:hypothetical protein
MEQEKEALLRRIEELLNFDGGDVGINPAYLAFLSVDELVSIKKGLEARLEAMNETHRAWMMQFVKEKKG